MCKPGAPQGLNHLADYSRRSFLKTVGSAAIVAGLPGLASAQSSPPQKLMLRQARLFDGKTTTLRDSVQILIEGNVVSSIDANGNPPPAGATVIDCAGSVVMPGLIDAHWLRSLPRCH